MASATLARETEVIVDEKEQEVPAAEPTVPEVAATESRDQVEGSGMVGESRAWNSRAQVD